MTVNIIFELTWPLDQSYNIEIYHFVRIRENKQKKPLTWLHVKAHAYNWLMCCRRQRGKPRAHQTEIRSLRDCSLIASRLMSKSSPRIDYDLQHQKVKYLGHFSFSRRFFFLICVERCIRSNVSPYFPCVSAMLDVDGRKSSHQCVTVRDLKMNSLCITVMYNEYYWPAGSSRNGALHGFHHNQWSLTLTEIAVHIALSKHSIHSISSLPCCWGKKKSCCTEELCGNRSKSVIFFFFLLPWI